MPSYHITIGGKNYDRALYETALKSVQGQGDGRISRDDAEKLLEKVLDAAPGQQDVYTDVEKRTVRMLREQLNWTPAADEHFRGTVASVAALKGWQTRLAGAGAEPPAVTPEPPASVNVAATVDKVVQELGLPRMKVEISAAEVEAQLDAFGGSVDFEAALRQAINSYLKDGDDGESPREVIRDSGPLPGVPDDLDAAVLHFMNQPTTKLSMVWRGPFDRDNPTSPYPPEHGESVQENWAFLLRIDSLSDHLHWAIVDRDGAEPTFNYGFN